MMLRRYEEPVDEFAAQEVVMLMESLARGDCFRYPAFTTRIPRGSPNIM